MKYAIYLQTVAFVIGLLIAAFGAVGIISPTNLVWVAEHAVSSGVFYAVALVRVVFGLVLISVAAISRAPKTLRVLGFVILISGITTTVMGLIAIEQAHSIIKWWLQQGSAVVRLTGLLVFCLGGFVAYACAPDRLIKRRHK
jgi:hypothetical protein